MLTRQVRRIYGRHVRERLTSLLFGPGRLSCVTRRELRDRARTDVTGYWTVGDGERVRVVEPAYADPLPDELRGKLGTWTFDPPFVAEVADVDLVGPNALPVTRGGEYVLENVQGSRMRVTDELFRSVRNGVVPRYRGDRNDHGRLASLVGPWSTEFFHWFTDQLPRLRYLREYERETGHEPPVLIPGDAPAWIDESLDMLGLSADRRVRGSGDRRHVDRLVVPSLPRQTESTGSDGYVHSPTALRYVAENLRAAASPSDRPEGVGTRLYVSRADQPLRHLRNEDEISPVLADYGFDTVKPERWSLREQVAAFAAADAVIGPHGAGLINAIYADDPTLVELFGRRTNPCFFAIAAGLGIEYAAVRGRQVGEDVAVAPERVERALERMMG